MDSEGKTWRFGLPRLSTLDPAPVEAGKKSTLITGLNFTWSGVDRSPFFTAHYLLHISV